MKALLLSITKVDAMKILFWADEQTVVRVE